MTHRQAAFFIVPIATPRFVLFAPFLGNHGWIKPSLAKWGIFDSYVTRLTPTSRSKKFDYGVWGGLIYHLLEKMKSD